MLNKKIVTHNGTFHADDLFASAVLSILLEKKGENFEIVRTRDIDIINSADYVFDVGGIYDPEKNRFDHHQTGGAGTHADGIPYAAFGLVWKKFGEEICESKEISERLEKKIVEAIDANDNGINLYETKGEITPFTIQDILFSFRPTWQETEDYDIPFFELLPFVKKILLREIKRMKDVIVAEDFVEKSYDQAVDKRLIILDGHYPWGEVMQKYIEPLYVISVKADLWRVECVRKDKFSFENRKNLPKEWAGKREDLAEITGVDDAIFCHNGLFLAVAKSKEGAIKLAELALQNNN